MKRITNLLILLLLAAVVFPGTADAQLLKRIKERAKERVERKVEDKADQAVDSAVDEAAEGVEDAAASAFERKTRAEDLNLGPNATGPANAPQVRYRSTTSMNLGALGRMARLFGKEIENQSETIAISGERQRTDADNQSTIIDLDTGNFVTLDHERRQYSVWSFDEMMQRMDEAVAEMEKQAEAPAAQPQTEQRSDEQDVEADVEFDMSVDRTGRKETINGAPSEQVLLTIRADFDVRSTDESGQEESVQGTTYALVDSWTSSELAGIETINDFQRRMAGQMAADLQASETGASISAMGLDPRMGELMKEAGEELEALDGMVVRSTMHLVLVPEGQELDVEAVLNPTDAGGDAGALEQMAANAEAEGDASPTQQFTLLRVTTQVSDLQIEPLPDDYFEVPADYKKVDLF